MVASRCRESLLSLTNIRLWRGGVRRATYGSPRLISAFAALLRSALSLAAALLLPALLFLPLFGLLRAALGAPVTLLVTPTLLTGLRILVIQPARSPQAFLRISRVLKKGLQRDRHADPVVLSCSTVRKGAYRREETIRATTRCSANVTPEARVRANTRSGSSGR
jgi:hypothetical protein